MKIIPFFIYLSTIIIIYFIYRIKKKKVTINWPILILRIYLPIFSFGLFGQIFLFLMTLFDCQDGHSYVSTELVCRTGDWFIYHSPFVIIALIFHISLALLTNSLYYKSLFIKSKSDVLVKTNSIPDITFLFTKIIIIVLFILDKQDEKEHWYILFILLLITGFNAYINLYFKNRLNIKLMLLNIIFSLILFFGFFNLCIGKIFQFLGFNGSFYSFIIGIICILAFILLYKSKEITYVLIDYKKINNINEYVNYILKYYRLISNSNNTRCNSTILKSYIETYEESCVDADCPLKIYLDKLNKGVNCQYLLFHFLDRMFKYGISKFENNIMLKNDYSMFLMSKMNNKNKAKTVLNSIKNDYYISFERNYNIYRNKRIIDRCQSKGNTFYFNYRSDIKEFKNLISKTIKLYYEFWSLLYGSKFQNDDNFKKLYNIGSNIMELNKKIEEIYKSIIKTKTNNIEIYRLFSEYLINIVNDNEKYQNYHKKATIYNKSIENEEKNYLNFNIDIIKNYDMRRYLLISGRQKDLGTIINISNGVSNLFGYRKEELIGKNLNIFIPDIFHFKHNKVLSDKSKQNNLKLFDDLFKRKEYIPNMVEGSFFGVLKSQFIKSLKLNVFFIKTEDNIIAFLVEFLKNIPYMNQLIRNRIINNSDIDTRCCILTNDNFLINSFTPNSVEQLGLSYRYIKSNNSIIPFIKQLYEDYLNAINDLSSNNTNLKSYINKDLIASLNETSRISGISDIKINNKKKITTELKRKIKDDLINKKYNKKCQITWRINKKNNKNKVIKNEENNNELEGKSSRISHRGSNYNLSTIRKPDEKRIEIEFLMEIKKAIIDNQLVGYYFYFSKLDISENKNFFIYNSTDNLDINDEFKKKAKYKTLFKPPQKSSIINKKKRFSNFLESKNNNNIENIKNSEISNSFIVKRAKIKETLEKNSSISMEDNYKNSYYFDFEPKIQKTISFNSAFDIKKSDIEEIIIDENFIPMCPYHFSFDLKNKCYYFEKNKNKAKLFKTILHKESLYKLNSIQNLKTIKNKKNKSSLSESYDDDYTSNSEESEENSNSESSNIDKETSSVDKNIEKAKYIKSTSSKNLIQAKIEKVNPIKGSKTLKIITEVKEENENEENKNTNKIYNKSNKNNNVFHSLKNIKNFYDKNNNNYYKVNLNKIHFLKYDFNKDMFVEGNKNEICIKIESIINIINSDKNRNNIISFGKDNKYPFISFKSKEEKKVKESSNNLDIIKNETKSEISVERKIKEAITNKGDDISITKLKIFLVLSFFVLVICGILMFIINYSFYNKFKEIILLLKSTISIKYTYSFGIYCIRELTLLNFNVTNIKGGVYSNFPAHNWNNYTNLLKSKILDLFKENLDSINNILSTKYSPSKTFQKTLSKNILESKFILSSGMESIKGDIYSILIQYNTVFEGLATSYTPILQSHSDMFNFMHNSFNIYRTAIIMLSEEYKNELILQKKNIKIIFIIIGTITFLLLIIICFFLIRSYLSVDKKRANYMEIFYGINNNSLKNLMVNCEKILNQIKKNEKKNIEDEEIEENSEEKKSLLKNKEQIGNNSGNMLLIKNNQIKNNQIISYESKLFIFIYFILVILCYTYFPCSFIVLNNISNKSNNCSKFIFAFSSYHLIILDSFNIYREYLFDNTSTIQEINTYDYLKKLEEELYDTMAANDKFTNTFTAENIKKDEKFFQLFSKGLCQHYITDYFNSVEECKQKYGNILNYDFILLIINFIANIRKSKNIAKYKLETEDVWGDLLKYEVEIWKQWKSDYIIEHKDKKISFKLDLFNNDIIHSNMNAFFMNIFFPLIDSHRKEIISRVLIEGDEKWFILLFCLFLILVFVIYFLYWIPIIIYLNNYIYKTKTMLLLIPMKLLVSQNKIKSMINLN